MLKFPNPMQNLEYTCDLYYYRMTIKTFTSTYLARYQRPFKQQCHLAVYFICIPSLPFKLLNFNHVVLQNTSSLKFNNLEGNERMHTKWTAR